MRLAFWERLSAWDQGTIIRKEKSSVKVYPRPPSIHSPIFSRYQGKMLSLHKTKAAHTMKQYGLGFISDRDIYMHVRETVLQYRRSISLKDFNKNLIDPVKLTFDAKIYGQDFRQTIESECIRQIDKTNNNRIGYFHQYLFKYAGNGWEVPANGERGCFDVVNDARHIYSILLDNPAQLKKKDKIALLIKFFNQLLKDKEAICYAIDLGDHTSKCEIWKVNIDGHEYFTERLKIISIDRFYEIVFQHEGAYWELCEKLPDVLNDIN